VFDCFVDFERCCRGMWEQREREETERNKALERKDFDPTDTTSDNQEKEGDAKRGRDRGTVEVRRRR